MSILGRGKATSLETANNAVGKLLLSGSSVEHLSQELGVDYDTARKLAARCRAVWAGNIEDIEGVRAWMFELALGVYRGALAYVDRDDVAARNKPAFYREARQSISLAGDLLGLKTLRVDVGSSQLAALMAGMMAVQRGQVIEAPNVKVIEDETTYQP